MIFFPNRFKREMGIPLKFIKTNNFASIYLLFRNFGLGDTNVHQELRNARNGKMEFIMSVNKRDVRIMHLVTVPMDVHGWKRIRSLL